MDRRWCHIWFNEKVNFCWLDLLGKFCYTRGCTEYRVPYSRSVLYLLDIITHYNTNNTGMHGRNLLNRRSFYKIPGLHPSFYLPTDPWALSIWLPKKVITAVKLFFELNTHILREDQRWSRRKDKGKGSRSISSRRGFHLNLFPIYYSFRHHHVAHVAPFGLVCFLN